MREIGLFGGTFNPVHHGHLAVARAARDQLNLERLIFIPCANPPHKESPDLVSAKHRIAMLELALAGEENMEISDIEVRRGGTSYTIDTVTQLQNELGECRLTFLIGSDSLLELHLWREIYRLLNSCRFATLLRPGEKTEDLSPGDIQLEDPWPQTLFDNIIDGSKVDVSSSEIRLNVRDRKSIRPLVHDDVIAYINNHKLYL